MALGAVCWPWCTYAQLATFLGACTSCVLHSSAIRRHGVLWAPSNAPIRWYRFGDRPGLAHCSLAYVASHVNSYTCCLGIRYRAHRTAQASRLPSSLPYRIEHALERQLTPSCKDRRRSAQHTGLSAWVNTIIESNCTNTLRCSCQLWSRDCSGHCSSLVIVCGGLSMLSHFPHRELYSRIDLLLRNSELGLTCPTRYFTPARSDASLSMYDSLCSYND